MARRKQPKPTRPQQPRDGNRQEELEAAGGDEEKDLPPNKRPRRALSPEAVWRDVILDDVGPEDGIEVAEINLNAVLSTAGISGLTRVEKCSDHASLRVRVRQPIAKNTVAIPKTSKQEWRVQLVECCKPSTCADAQDRSPSKTDDQHSDFCKVVSCGEVDGPDYAISALAYLTRLGYTSLRPAPCLSCGSPGCRDHESSSRVRVLICRLALPSSDEVHPSQRPHLWMTAMQILISWLRPEVVSETRAGATGLSYHEEITVNFEMLNGGSGSGKQPLFDPSALYDAIKPSLNEPDLQMSFPELRPDLRPYQRRAAYWMVQRERGFGASMAADQSLFNQQCPSTSGRCSPKMSYPDQHPLWLPIVSLDTSSTFFFNPNTGAVSSQPHDFVSYVKGGILADEMGLGKTVELLACILSNPFKAASGPNAAEEAKKLLGAKIKTRKCDRVECACGVLEADEMYGGSWVQCDVCDAWQHATCVGYTSSTDRKRVRRTADGVTRKFLSPRPELGKGDPENFDIIHEGEDLLKEDDFVCGACAELIGSIEVRGDCSATLIVCPDPLLQQWQDEISRHTRAGSLRVIVYEGVGKGAFIVMGGKDRAAEDNQRLKIVSAHDLAAADIVLTTYSTLRADLFHDSDKSVKNDRSLRHVKRYPVVPTPLTRLSWWRMCLDEAQMVENKTKASEMALLVDAQNRWCVTGTPIQRRLDDLFGLLRIIDARPFHEYRNWTQALRRPYEAGDAQAINYMHRFLRAIMWRSSKEQVKDELGIPPQSESLSWLRFSPVEAHFYRQQHERCAIKARAVISKYNRKPKQSRNSPALLPSTQVGILNRSGAPGNQGPVLDDRRASTEFDRDEAATQRYANTRAGIVGENLGAENQTIDSSIRTVNLSTGNTSSYFDEDRPLSDSEASNLSFSLLRLRQACCHPQVGSAGIRSLQQQNPLTMDEILQVLVDKAKTEAEEAQRALIGTLNGLAALAAIENDVPLAVSIYREALSLTDESEADMDVDPLQKLHTLHNLADILWNAEQISVNGTCNTRKNCRLSDRPLQGINEGPFVGGADDVLGKEFTATGLHLRGRKDRVHLVASVSYLGGTIPRTLRDDILVKQCHEIRSKYLAAFHTKLAYEQVEFERANLQVSEEEKILEECGGQGWWLQVLSLLKEETRLQKEEIRLQIKETRLLKKETRTAERPVTSKKRPPTDEDLLFKIRSHLLESDNFGKRGRHRNASSLAFRFREVSGLELVVQKELDALASAHEQVTKRLKELIQSMKNPTARDVEKIVLCPRDSENVTGTICAHCEMDDIFQAYENKLFLLRTSAAAFGGLVSAEDAVIAQHRILAQRRISGLRDDEASTGKNPSVSEDVRRNKRGTTATEAEVLRAPSETEQILSIIKSYARTNPSLQKAATRHLHLFEAMKKEYSQMRALTKIQRELLYALDELNMATTRLSLQVPGEKIESEIEMLVKVHAEEVPQRNVQLTSEKFDALKDFSRTKGQLRYLKGLSMARRQQNKNRGSTHNHRASHEENGSKADGWRNIEEETCPVCQEKIGSQVMVLPCGHLLCCKCCLVMIDRASVHPNGVSQKRITCPHCRHRTYVGDIALVDNSNGRNVIAQKMGQFSEGGTADEETEATIQVNGSYGTKISAVVRRLLWLKVQHRNSKVIIFSTWKDVLNVIEHALVANKITFARVNGAKINAAIQSFRGTSSKRLKTPRKSGPAADEAEHIQVLLLPLNKGGNGLNLVEAQHVMLVEALPNPAVEAQAINRVHRIGQTRATFVHRFIVSDTVEERIYWLGRKNAEVMERFPGHGLAKFGKGGQYAFTLNDVSALFDSDLQAGSITGGEANSLSTVRLSVPSHLTPAAAAAAAAEARLRSSAGS